MRDVLTVPVPEGGSLIIASDNSGAIGLKEDDLVHVPYDVLSYFSFRVAAMECIAAGGEPISVVLHNFCGNGAWGELTSGIRKGLQELGMKDIPITGSTESNFSLLQSAVGLLVLGKMSFEGGKLPHFNEEWKIAVIGLPLVGNEVIKKAEQIVPLSIFQEISKLQEVLVWPVGSKGVLYELNQLFSDVKIEKDSVIADVDMMKSSGPATCFIAVFQGDRETEITKLAGNYLHSVQIKIMK